MQMCELAPVPLRSHSPEPPLSFTLTLATNADREAIYRLRHEVYASELRQHSAAHEGKLRDPLDDQRDTRKESAGVAALPASGCAYEAERCALRLGNPRSELDGRPVMVGADEWHEAGKISAQPAGRQRHLGWPQSQR